MNNYEKQANDFLAKTGTKIKIFDPRYKKHFLDDVEKRLVWRVCISKGGRKFSFDFGESISNTEKVVFNGRIALIESKIPKPSNYTILAYLQKDDVGSFDDFCSCFGYDRESTNAKKIYKACEKEYLQMSTLFSDAELEEMQEIN